VFYTDYDGKAPNRQFVSLPGIGISINTTKHDGSIVEAGMDGPSKLWELKKGDQ